MKSVRITTVSFCYFDKRIVYFLMAFFLCVSLFFTVINFYHCRVLTRETDIYRNRITQLTSAEKKMQDKETTEIGEEEIRNAQKLRNFVNHLIAKDIFPWDRILAALEENIPENVYLQSLIPDKSFRKIIIKGYADSMSEVSNYLKEKEYNELFEQIALQKINVGQDTEAKTDTGKTPAVEFVLESTLRFSAVFPEKTYGEFWKKWEALSDKS